MSTNDQYLHGYEEQVEEYGKAECTDKMIYVFIDLGNPGRLKKLTNAHELNVSDSKKVPELLLIDATAKAADRKEIAKEEINRALQKIDPYLGQTLFVENANIKPDGGLIEVKDDNGNWRVVLVSEAKHQGKDIENIRKGQLVGKNGDQDLMVAGNAIERSHKNISEIANYMLAEPHFPYILFLEGSNFLTHNVTVTRPDGRKVTLIYNSGTLNRLDRLTAANYGMPINTNLCENRFVTSNGRSIMLQAASIYTQSDGEHWSDEDMIEIMLEVAKTSLQLMGKDLFKQITQITNYKK